MAMVGQTHLAHGDLTLGGLSLGGLFLILEGLETSLLKATGRGSLSSVIPPPPWSLVEFGIKIKKN